MCGIFSYLGPKKNAGDIVLAGLKSLEYRGYDSWGVALKQKNNRIFIDKRVGKIGDAKLPSIESYAAIGHTRWATHGSVTERNAHPYTDCKQEVIIVHNGIIENFEGFKDNLIKKGHIFKSETDSEVIAHLIEDGLKASNDLVKIVLKIFASLKGLNAIIAFLPATEEFFAIKNGSPLIFGYNKKQNEYFFASDPSALLPHTDSIYFMEDNELLLARKEGYELFDMKEKRKDVHFIHPEYKPEEFHLGSYKHYMLKEIHEQPRVLENIISTEKQNITLLAEKINSAFGTYFIGCGTAYYACLAGMYLFSKIAKKHINVSVASEFSYLIDFLKKGSLVIALSQSGETIDVISSIKKAQEKQAKIVSITNVLGSTLYRMADYKLLLNAGPEKCVLSTKSFTAKIAILHLLAHSLQGDFGKGAAQIRKAIREVKKLIKQDPLKPLIDRLKNKEHIFVIGRGVSYPTALEAALKIKEVSYIHAEGLAAGELKHGVIALIEKGTPVIVFNPADETYEDTLSSAYEVKARGAHIIGVSCKSHPVYDDYIEIKKCDDATIIPHVVIAQLLGYHLAVAKGLDPDKPRNLAKSVTVK